MSRIRGWKKVIDERGTKEWFNKSGQKSARIFKEDGIWVSEIEDMSGYMLTRLSKTQEEAEKIAINYMRRHPNG